MHPLGEDIFGVTSIFICVLTCSPPCFPPKLSIRTRLWILKFLCQFFLQMEHFPFKLHFSSRYVGKLQKVLVFPCLSLPMFSTFTAFRHLSRTYTLCSPQTCLSPPCTHCEQTCSLTRVPDSIACPRMEAIETPLWSRFFQLSFV